MFLTFKIKVKLVDSEQMSTLKSKHMQSFNVLDSDVSYVFKFITILMNIFCKNMNGRPSIQDKPVMTAAVVS